MEDVDEGLAWWERGGGLPGRLQYRLPSSPAPGSPLSPARRQPLSRAEVMPALLEVQSVSSRAAPKGDVARDPRATAAMPTAFPVPGGGVDAAGCLEEQRRCVGRLLGVLWDKALPQTVTAGEGQPFASFPARVLPREGGEEEEEEVLVPGPQPGQMVIQRRQNRGTVEASCAIAVLPGGPDARRFIGSPSSSGYMRLTLANKRPGAKRKKVRVLAHRLVCWAFHGPPPSWDRNVASHMCGNPLCLCPLHLAWMTRQEDAVCREWHKRARAQARPSLLYHRP